MLTIIIMHGSYNLSFGIQLWPLTTVHLPMSLFSKVLVSGCLESDESNGASKVRKCGHSISNPTELDYSHTYTLQEWQREQLVS